MTWEEIVTLSESRLVSRHPRARVGALTTRRCRHCKKTILKHTLEGKCLFEPTHYTPAVDTSVDAAGTPFYVDEDHRLGWATAMIPFVAESDVTEVWSTNGMTVVSDELADKLYQLPMVTR